MTNDEKSFLIDANILIDIQKVDEDFLTKISNIGIVIIPLEIIDEVSYLDLEYLFRLGFKPYDTDLKVMEEAMKIADNSGLTFNDALCLLISKKENYICITNDKALYNRCKNDNVQVMWCLEFILLFVTMNYLKKTRAKAIAKKLQSVNIKITEKIMNKFLEELAKI